MSRICCHREKAYAIKNGALILLEDRPFEPEYCVTGPRLRGQESGAREIGMIGRFPETVGQYLRRERESRSISLEELSRTSRIGLPFLEALEGDDFGFFSQQEFILGFLKGYARHLGLNLEEVLRRYRIQSELTGREEKFRQMPLFPGPGGSQEDSQEAKPDSSGIPKPQRRKRFHGKILLQIIIVSAALGLSWYIHHILKTFEKGEKTPSGGAISSEKASQETPPSKEKPRSQEKGKDMALQGKRAVVANRKKKLYYLPGMKEYDKANPDHRVHFDSEKEAVKTGYQMTPRRGETERPG